MKRKIGIIGGTALSHLKVFQEGPKGWRRHDTTHFGNVWLCEGQIGDQEVILLPRHGPGHRTPPHKVNYVGNLVALRQLGVTEVIAVSAMGGLADGYEPGKLVFVSDTIDKTWGRVSTVFDDNVAAHIAQGICPRLRHRAHLAAEAIGIAHQSEGTLVVIPGPQFSTPAESAINRASGVHVVGMTSQPEAKIARELGLCYVLIGQVTDLDNPHGGHQGVTQQEVSSRIADLSYKAACVIMALIPDPVSEVNCGCGQSLVGAILTAPDHMAIPSSRLCTTFGIKQIPPEWFASH